MKFPVFFILLFWTFLVSFSHAADLTSLRQKYQSALGSIVLGEQAQHRNTVRKNLNQRYVANLEILRRKIQQTGDLDGTRAVLSEIDRFKTSATVPTQPDESLKAALRDARDWYRAQEAGIQAGMNRQLKGLTEKYLGALAKLQRQLVIAGSLDAAEAVALELKTVKRANNDVLKGMASAPRVPPGTNEPAPIINLPFDRPFQDGFVQSMGSVALIGRIDKGRWEAGGFKGGAARLQGGTGITFPAEKILDAGPEGITFSFWVQLDYAPEKSPKDIFWFSKGTWEKRIGYYCKSALHEKDLRVFSAEGLVLLTPQWMELEAKTWNHIAIAFKGDRAQIFFNGIMAGEESAPGKTLTADPSAPLEMLHGLVGLVDNIRIFDRMLFPAEIAKEASRPE